MMDYSKGVTGVEATAGCDCWWTCRFDDGLITEWEIDGCDGLYTLSIWTSTPVMVGKSKASRSVSWRWVCVVAGLTSKERGVREQRESKN